MEIFPEEGLLVFTSLRGMIYNSNLIPKEKTPKTYEDLVDPRLSPTWAGKLAIPPYVSWLVELSMIWSEERVKNFTRKLVAISGGRLRYSEEERVVSGEFPHRSQHGRCRRADVAVASQRRAAHGSYRVNSSAALVFSIGRAKKFGASQSSEVIRRLYGLERSPRHSR